MRVANSERERDREDIDKEKEIGLMNKCFSAPLAKCLGYLSSPLLEDIPGNREKKKDFLTLLHHTHSKCLV